MIPYIKVPDLKILDPLIIHPFGILVATGVLVGTALTTRRAKKLGFDVHILNSFVTWMLVSGFIFGHVLDQLFYSWEEVKRNPISLIKLWDGLSSFGGFTGAIIGIVLWKIVEWVPGRGLKWHGFPGRPILPFADLVLSVFPIGWMFGRMGCSVVHDHRGALAPPGTLVAVTYPPETGYIDPAWVKKIGFIELINGPDLRFDLGLLEMMFTVIVAICFTATWGRKLATGTYVVAACLCYAPVRFVMDYFRLQKAQGGDVRYAGLTPAQWACIALFCFGLYMAYYVANLKKKGLDPSARYKVKTRESSEPKLVGGASPG
jgi:phosphatidylglycerol:prolipoprotein diacylglycerol transferase